MSFFDDFVRVYKDVEADPSTIDASAVLQSGKLILEERVRSLEDSFAGRHLWWNIMRAVRDELLIFSICGLLMAILTVLLPWSLQALFTVLDQRAPSAGGVMGWSLLVSLLILASLGIGWYRTWRELRLVLLVRQVMTRVLFRRLQRIDASALREKTPLYYITAYAPQLSQVVYAADFALTTLTIAVLIVALLVWFGIAALAVLAVVALLTIALQQFIVAIGRIYYQYMEADQTRVNLVQQGIAELGTITRQYLEPQLLVGLAAVRRRQVAILRRRAWRQIVNRTLEDNVALLCSLSLVALAILTKHLMNPERLFPLLVLLGSLLTAIDNNLANFRVLRNTVGPTHDVEALFRDHPVLPPPADSTDSGLRAGEVTFVDPETGKVSSLRPGVRVAVIGRTGAGKSHLLAQLAAADGRHRQDGPLRVAGSAVLVERNQPLFDGQLAELVTLWQRPVDMPRYVAALTRSGLLTDLSDQGEGDARLVSSQDKSLSEGQIQRLSLARALYVDPDLLLLDDVFAPMDPELAHSVAGQILGSAAEQPTRIFVTSRLEMTRYADAILVVDRGRCALVDPSTLGPGSDSAAVVESFIGSELTQRLCAARQAAPERAPQLPSRSPEIHRLALRHDLNAPPPAPHTEAFDVSQGRPIRLVDLARNALGLFPRWTIATLITALAAFLLAGMIFAALVDQLHSTPGDTLLRALTAIVTISVGAAALRYSLSFLPPISATDRLHRLLVQSLTRMNDQRAMANQGNRLVGRLTQDFFELEMETPNGLVSLAAGLLDAVLYVGFLVIVSPFSLIALVPFTIIAYRSYRRSKTAVVAAGRLRASVRGPLFGFIGPALGSASYQLSSPIRRALTRRFTTLADIEAAGSYRSALAGARVSLFIQGLGVVLFLAVLWPVAGLRIASGQTVSGLATSVVLFLIFTFSQRVSTVIERLQAGDTLLTKFERLAELLDRHTLPSLRDASHQDAADPRQLYARLLDDEPSSSPAPAGGIRATHLTYGFSDRNVLFDDLSLTVEPGERVALVGPSGVGKSTLTRILTGALPPLRGQVSVGGLTPRNRSVQTRAQLWYLESTIPPLRLTVQDFLDPFAAASSTMLRSAFTALGENPDQWMSRLLLPIDQLSRGERQILNLCRAVLSRPPTLILDEATSGLDSMHERIVIERLFAALPGTTMLAILHRPDNLDLFARVLTLEQRTLRESRELARR